MKGLKETAVKFIWHTEQQALISFKKEREFVALYERIKSERGIKVVNPCEAFNIVRLVKATSKVEGAIAELGVYKGGSAKLICEHKGDKWLHLFDTFLEGLPTPSAHDTGGLKKGDFSTSLAGVKEYLKEYEKVYYHMGLFPETTKGLEDMSFSLVNIDADLYQSTKDAIEFFYPRMSRGGIMLFHDYNGLEGVKKAVNQFMELQPEPIIDLYVSQAAVVL